jgi:hypothetical protein
VSEAPLYGVIEDAIWQALDGEQAMPHSGVDPSYVVPEFLRLLAVAGYTVTPKLHLLQRLRPKRAMAHRNNLLPVRRLLHQLTVRMVVGSGEDKNERAKLE